MNEAQRCSWASKFATLVQVLQSPFKRELGPFFGGSQVVHLNYFYTLNAQVLGFWEVTLVVSLMLLGSCKVIFAPFRLMCLFCFARLGRINTWSMRGQQRFCALSTYTAVCAAVQLYQHSSLCGELAVNLFPSGVSWILTFDGRKGNPYIYIMTMRWIGCIHYFVLGATRRRRFWSGHVSKKPRSSIFSLLKSCQCLCFG